MKGTCHCLLARLKPHVLQYAGESHLDLQNAQAHAYTVAWTSAKGEERERLQVSLVLGKEPGRVETAA